MVLFKAIFPKSCSTLPHIFKKRVPLKINFRRILRYVKQLSLSWIHLLFHFYDHSLSICFTREHWFSRWHRWPHRNCRNRCSCCLSMLINKPLLIHMAGQWKEQVKPSFLSFLFHLFFSAPSFNLKTQNRRSVPPSLFTSYQRA